MTFNLFSHILVYTSLLSILVLSLLYSPWHWLSKLTLVILVPCACVLSFQTWRQAQGWPSNSKVPNRFMLNSAIVEEPDAQLGSEGGVYIWLTDLSHHQLDKQPRAYRLAYDEKLHAGIQQALRKARNGKLQIGEVKRTIRQLDSFNPNQSVGGQEDELINFKDLPDPALPEK